MNKIKLNVGGTKFTTSLSTLTNEKDTMLSAMFSGNFDMQPDEDGEYFIDRNPKFFPLILDHLRKSSTVAMAIAALSPLERDELREEAQFYQIRSLLDLIGPAHHFLPEFCGSPLQLSNNNTCIKFINEYTDWESSVLCSKTNKICIRLIRNCKELRFGFASKTDFDAESGSATSNGWYLSVYDGTLFSQSSGNSTEYLNSPCNHNGTIITAEWDESARSITFSVNGTSYRPAFVGKVKGDLYPALCFCIPNSEVEIINNT